MAPLIPFCVMCRNRMRKAFIVEGDSLVSTMGWNIKNLVLRFDSHMCEVYTVRRIYNNGGIRTKTVEQAGSRAIRTLGLDLGRREYTWLCHDFCLKRFVRKCADKYDTYPGLLLTRFARMMIAFQVMPNERHWRNLFGAHDLFLEKVEPDLTTLDQVVQTVKNQPCEGNPTPEAQVTREIKRDACHHENKLNPLDKLPADIVFRILKELRREDIPNLRLASRAFAAASTINNLGQSWFKHQFLSTEFPYLAPNTTTASDDWRGAYLDILKRTSQQHLLGFKQLWDRFDRLDPWMADCFTIQGPMAGERAALDQKYNSEFHRLQYAGDQSYQPLLEDWHRGEEGVVGTFGFLNTLNYALRVPVPLFVNHDDGNKYAEHESERLRRTGWVRPGDGSRLTGITVFRFEGVAPLLALRGIRLHMDGRRPIDHYPGASTSYDKIPRETSGHDTWAPKNCLKKTTTRQWAAAYEKNGHFWRPNRKEMRSRRAKAKLDKERLNAASPPEDWHLDLGFIPEDADSSSFASFHFSVHPHEELVGIEIHKKGHGDRWHNDFLNLRFVLGDRRGVHRRHTPWVIPRARRDGNQNDMANAAAAAAAAAGPLLNYWNEKPVVSTVKKESLLTLRRQDPSQPWAIVARSNELFLPELTLFGRRVRAREVCLNQKFYFKEVRPGQEVEQLRREDAVWKPVAGEMGRAWWEEG